MEEFSEFLFGAVEAADLGVAEVFAGAVGVKGEHGHGRLEGGGFPAMAAFGRALDGAGDAHRVALQENVLLKVHGVAGGSDLRRPAARRCFLFLHGGSFRFHVQGGLEVDSRECIRRARFLFRSPRLQKAGLRRRVPFGAQSVQKDLASL